MQEEKGNRRNSAKKGVSLHSFFLRLLTLKKNRFQIISATRSGFSLIVALLLTASLAAQIPAGYYNNAAGKTGEALQIALYNIL